MCLEDTGYTGRTGSQPEPPARVYGAPVGKLVGILTITKGS